MTALENRNGLVFGVANDKSIAWAIAQAAVRAGARVGLNYVNERMERRVRPLAESIDAPLCLPCDVTDDAALDAFFSAAGEAFDGRLDFVVHSLAYAPREDLLGAFVDTSRDGYRLAMDISAFSLLALTRRALPLMAEGGAVLAMTYYGAEKVVDNYRVMGPAKAALEANIRYLACELGPRGVRVNGLSAGPVKTLAAAGIPGFRDMLRAAAQINPLRRNVSLEEIGAAATFLLSPAASAITGEILHVDAGFHALGAGMVGS